MHSLFSLSSTSDCSSRFSPASHPFWTFVAIFSIEIHAFYVSGFYFFAASVAFSNAAFFVLERRRKLSKTERGETLFHAIPRLRMDSDRAKDNISSLREERDDGWVRRLKPARQWDFIGVYLLVMGMKPFKTAGSYRGKETKMRYMYVYVCARAFSQKEKNTWGRVGERNVSNARKKVFDQSYTCELTSKLCENMQRMRFLARSVTSTVYVNCLRGLSRKCRMY